ncbi:MAG TPA: FtsX-like permease family protein, partial [Solirubrobacterales bacterium]|nr:FtsX-like permease family protein [Solirubrobacterales bacterium]
MTKLALRGMAERKLRSALTAIAVLLGVSMISGTYVLTDQIRDSFQEILETGNEGTDAILTPETEFSSSYSQEERLPASLVETAREVPGVESAAGQSEAFGALIVDGEEIRTVGAPNLVFGTSPEPFDATEPAEGRDPINPGEIAVSRDLAEEHGIEVGDRVQLETSEGAQDVTVVGLVNFGGEGSAAGYGFTIATPEDIARWYDQEGEVSSVSVAAAEGVSPEELVRRLEAVVPAGVKVETGQENAAEEAQDISSSINSFLGPALLVFAGAALLVGAFIIFNTFSISVAERTPELASLRTLGATRGQVLRLIAVEALVIGVTASVAGLFGGLVIAKLIGALFDAGGIPIPTGGLALAARTIELALGIGIGVTMVAAIGPALRATRVAPAIALEEGARLPASRASRFAPYAAVLVTAGGLVLLLVGLFGSGPATSRLLNMAAGAVLLFVGLALVAKYIVRPVAAAIGMPLERAFPVLGQLARENAQRNPGRTALTAAALMVGLGMVVFVAVFTSGLKASINDSIDRLINAEIVVTTGGGFEPIPERAREIAERIPGVESASGVYYDQIEVNGEKSNILYDALGGIDPSKVRSGYAFDWIDGSDELLSRLRGNNTVIEEQFSKAHDVGVGDSFELVTPSGGRATLTAIGIYRDPQLLQGLLVDRETLRTVSPTRDPFLLLVSTDPGADTDQVRASIAAALQRFPVAEVEDQAGLRDQLSSQTDQIVYLLYALLAMSVLISLFGIANSLFLSIHERTREFGLLRAVGATRRQVRRMVRYESAITAAIGSLLGTAIGILFAVLITESLDNLGLSLRIPVGQLIVFMLLAVLVGIVGAVLPARRGARINVLE